MVLHRLDQRALLAADVAARADEDLDRERLPRAQHVAAAEAHRLGARDRLAADLDLLFVLVPDIDVASLGAAQPAGEEHPLDDQVRRAQQQLTVLERPRLALVAVDDDELPIPPSLPDIVPLLVRPDARAAHAAEVADLELLDQLVAVGLGDEAAERRVFLATAVGVDLPAQRRAVGVLGLQGGPPLEAGQGQGPAHQIAVVVVRFALINILADHDGRRAVAAAEARDPADPDLALTDLRRQLLQVPTQSGHAAEVARHVTADPHFHRRRLLQPEVREEARHLVQTMQRGVSATLGERLQLGFGQVSASLLDLVKLLDDRSIGRHRPAPELMGDPKNAPVTAGTGRNARPAGGSWPLV